MRGKVLAAAAAAMALTASVAAGSAEASVVWSTSGTVTLTPNGVDYVFIDLSQQLPAGNYVYSMHAAYLWFDDAEYNVNEDFTNWNEDGSFAFDDNQVVNDASQIKAGYGTIDVGPYSETWYWPNGVVAMEENVYLTFPDNYTAWFNAPGKPETISYTFSIATAPEPATWAMLVVGLGLIGAALRRRTLAAACG